ncbi:response regulator [Magnetospirillum sp. SS-4]|uniref:response regulator n=1 Tax=Magnetospirillum sp. SS-4 TaxID=2681465 RepID=UPI001382934B|nr:response regulator [Magnetospirillum sp. SS-4]CAA7614415.1 Sensor protein gacS [Magnetospirillum sp. SS-4]
MLSSRTRIVTRLTAGFAALLLLTAIMAGMAYRTMSEMAATASDLYRHPFAVTNALMQVRTHINGLRADMLTLVRSGDQDEVERIAARMVETDADIHRNLDVIRSQYLGDVEAIQRVTELLARYRSTRERNIFLARSGRFDDAVANAAEFGGPQYTELRRELEAAYTFALGKAADFHRRIESQRDETALRIVLTLAALLILGYGLAWLITRSITVPLNQLRVSMGRLSAGDLSTEIPNREGSGEVVEMARAVEVFKHAARRLDSQRWVKDGVARLSAAIQTTETTADFAAAALGVLTPLLGGGVALFHVRAEGGFGFAMAAGWGAAGWGGGTTGVFSPGEGLAGQCVVSKTPLFLEDLPANYLRIGSGLGQAAPRVAMAAPVMAHGRVLAVVEMASLAPFSEQGLAFLEEALPVLGLNLEVLERNIRTRELLIETQAQAEQLRSSEEELRVQSEALQSANEELRAGEEELRIQQEALEAVNEELRLKGEALEERGRSLEQARAEADRRAVELDQASRYKSEFLANMSHELRTPLNSLLILSKSLADNEDGNLTPDQVESASVVFESGNHLLGLINDILDLSKVEAGKMRVNAAEIAVSALAAGIRRRFQPVAADKGLVLSVEIADGLPEEFVGDRGKIEQIVNNLVGNAVKFTAAGGVRVRLAHPGPAEMAAAVPGGAPGSCLALSVTDSGVGIAPSDQDRIFRAFEQVDGSTSRQFGGTGLGLTISRQLARLMGGEVLVDSKTGGGSTFTLVLPLTQGPPAAPPPAILPPAILPVEAALPPRPAGVPGHQPLLLVIEDDAPFLDIVCDLARKRGFRTLACSDGLDGVEMARRHRPTGIVLDIGLPRLDGWGVIDALRRAPETRDIPVHVISAADEKLRARETGTVGFLAKPVSKAQIEGAFESLLQAAVPADGRHLLLVDGDAGEREAIAAILAGLDLDITHCASGAEAFALLQLHAYDGVILAPGLPDMDGAALLERMTRERVRLPAVIVYSSAELTQDQTLRLREFTDSIIIRGSRSSERLRDEVSLFLHSVEARLNRDRTVAPTASEPRFRSLAGRTALVVDDDMRNAFALSKVLRGRGLKVLIAQDGAKALKQLDGQDRVDIILMDIMMPGMDGYQTMERIRGHARHARLPIIALTAKAMAGDRDRCIAAGASDYMAKPVDLERLMELMAGHFPGEPDAG